MIKAVGQNDTNIRVPDRGGLEIQPEGDADRSPEQKSGKHDNHDGGVHAIDGRFYLRYALGIINHGNRPSTDNVPELTIFSRHFKRREQVRCSKTCCSTLIVQPKRTSRAQPNISGSGNHPETDEL